MINRIIMAKGYQEAPRESQTNRVFTAPQASPQSLAQINIQTVVNLGRGKPFKYQGHQVQLRLL